MADSDPPPTTTKEQLALIRQAALSAGWPLRSALETILAERLYCNKRRLDVEAKLGQFALAIAVAAGIDGVATGDEIVARVKALAGGSVLKFLAHPYATRLDLPGGDGATAHWYQRVSVDAVFDGSDCCVEDRHVHADTIEAACQIALDEMVKRPPDVPAPSMHGDR